MRTLLPLVLLALAACQPSGELGKVDGSLPTTPTVGTTPTTGPSTGSTGPGTDTVPVTTTPVATTDPTTTPPTGTSTAVPPLPRLWACHDAPEPDATGSGSWNESLSSLIVLGEPGHAAVDTLATDAGDLQLEAKFAYGVLSTDLTGEDVEVWVDDCSGAYVLAGEATTDGDGRVHLSFPPSALPGYGSYGLVYRVKVDGTLAKGTLRMFPVGTQLVVTDIDGTLTTGDSELLADLISELLGGGFVPDERLGAFDAMWARTDQGYPLVYLTGRPYTLRDLTLGWLDDLGYPKGTLQLAPSNADILPNNDSVGAYKAAYLEGLAAQGFELTWAYGNAETDIFGYLEAGIAPEHAYILGAFGGVDGTTALGEDYLDHLVDLAAETDPVQPFAWP